MASYTKLAKNNWQVVVSLGYDINGKKKRIKKQGFKLKSDAEKFANEILAQNQNGYKVNSSNNILFKNFILEWYENYQSLNLSISTQACYIGRINSHIIPKLGTYKLNEINNVILQRFYNSLIKEKKLKASAAKKVFDILVSCFKYAKKQKLIYDMPTDINKLTPEKPDIKCWSKDEIDFFLNSIKGTYLYTPVFTEIFTGLRIAELCGLRWCDIDFKHCTLTVNNQVIFDRFNKKLFLTSKLKTPTSYRVISIPKLLVNHLQNIKSKFNYGDFDYVILSRDGEICNPRNLSMNFTRTVAKYKYSIEEIKMKYPDKDLSNYRQLKQITFHGLRHTHATILIANGENVKVVSERLGHRDINITLNTYTHVIKKMQKGTADLLDRMFITI